MGEGGLDFRGDSEGDDLVCSSSKSTGSCSSSELTSGSGLAIFFRFGFFATAGFDRFRSVGTDFDLCLVDLHFSVLQIVADSFLKKSYIDNYLLKITWHLSKIVSRRLSRCHRQLKL